MADFDVGGGGLTMAETVGPTFWYKLLDLMHYTHLHLTSPERGYMVWTKGDWAACFYKEQPSESSDRAWERWKVKARKEGLLGSLPGDVDELPSAISHRIVIHVTRAQDAIYLALGAPHPGGLQEQVRCERQRRDSLIPLVVRGIAAAAQVEQRRRMVG